MQYQFRKEDYNVDDKAIELFTKLINLDHINTEEGFELYYQLDKYIWETQQPTEILDDAAGSFYSSKFGREIDRRYERDGINPYEAYKGYNF